MKKLFILSLLVALSTAVPVSAAPAAANTYADAVLRIESCEAILQEFMADPALAIPAVVLQRARGIVISNQARGGFFLGIKDGYAALMVRRADNTWSVPVILSAGEGSFGLQAGFTKIETIYMIMDDETPRKFFQQRFNIGVDAKAVAGPRYAEREHLDDTVLANSVLVYTRSKGLYAGLSVKGGWLSRNDRATGLLYNTTYTLPEILYSDWIQPTDDVRPLMNLVRSLAP